MTSLSMGAGGWYVAMLAGLVPVVLSACAHSARPPVAKVAAKNLELHGDLRVDNYHWLRHRDNPEVISYLEAENTYTRAMMKHTEFFQDALYREMLGRIQETDMSAPVQYRGYAYYHRTEKGKQYPIHCRQKAGGLEEVLLDENRLASGHDYFELGQVEISPNQRLLAYITDTSGAESFTLYVKDLQSGALLPDRIEGLYYGLVWANDNRNLFYVVHDDSKRPYKVYRHVLGTDPRSDVLVYHEKDKAFHVALHKTRSEAYVVIDVHSTTTNEAWFVPAHQPETAPEVIQTRRHKMEYSVSHHGKQFLIVTNDDAQNFRVMQAPVATPSRAFWKEVIPHRPDIMVEGIDVFKEHMVVYERKNGLELARIVHLPSNQFHYLEFPEPAYHFHAGANWEFDTQVLRYGYTSLITPDSVFEYDMNSRKVELIKEQPVLGGYVKSRYVSERIFTQAPDGTRVPISLAYKKGLEKDGDAPLYLKAYGSYGSSYDPRFDSTLLALLDRGFVVAIAHVRGGSELGRPWYDAGKLMNKKNTFTDFIACAETLIADGYTSADRLVIVGGSAGGLLIGAVVNLRPALFHVAVAHVPFVDVVTTMLDESIPLTVIEFEEWGNPRDKSYYEYMKSYSPYDNVEPKDYPHMLVTAGLNDPRVQYWEPAKWIAKLRATRTDENLLLLKTYMGTGHFGPSGRYEELKEQAFEFAFILNRLGFDE
jgi:oligopeptidase B